MVSLKQIFDWFKTGLYPTENQFRETWKSFWHKSERIPAENIDGLPELLDKKSVLYTAQNLTEEQKLQAQKNIGIDFEMKYPYQTYINGLNNLEDE